MENDIQNKYRRHVKIAITFCIVLALLLVGTIVGGNFMLGSRLSMLTVEQVISPAKTFSEDQARRYQTYYNQEVSWDTCNDPSDGNDDILDKIFGSGSTNSNTNFECATIKAPLDWSKSSDVILPDFKVSNYSFDSEDNASIDLRLIRTGSKNADGSIKPYLYTNPGGPGGSGVSFLPEIYNMIPFDLVDKFAIASWDPRGVGLSSAINCFADDKSKLGFLSEDPAGKMPDNIETVDKINQQFADACKKRSGALLKYVDTQSSARDLELIRAITTDAKLNYLGFSYGTKLGAVYAGMFSEQTDKFVLDGADPANISYEDMSVSQAGGFQTALDSYLQDCISGGEASTSLSYQDENQTISCPFAGQTLEYANSWLKAAADKLEKTPIKSTTDMQELNSTTLFYGIGAALYSKTSWKYLTLAIIELKQHAKADVFLSLTDSYFEYDAKTGTFSSNMLEANSAINCLDDRAEFNLEKDKADETKIMEISPTLGAGFAYGDVECKAMPKATGQVEYDASAPNSPSVVVISTLRDPATPYQQGKDMADSFVNGVLLTYDSDGHTAFLEDTGSLSRDVVNYFISGVTPENGKMYKPGE